MPNPTGGYQTISPILGTGQQQQDLQTLASQVFTGGPNGNTIQGITPYGGQLTPNLNQMMLSGVDAAWNPNSPGQSQMSQQYGNILNLQNQANAANPLAGLQAYAGGGGTPTPVQTPANPYGGMMAPQTPNYGYQYQPPNGQGNMGGGPSPSGGSPYTGIPVQFNYPAPTTPSPPTQTPVTPNIPYQSINDPSLLPRQLGGVGGGSMSTLAWQQMMNGTSTPSSKPTSSSNNVFQPKPSQLTPVSPYVNYNPAFSAAAWGTGYSPSFI